MVAQAEEGPRGLGWFRVQCFGFSTDANRIFAESSGMYDTQKRFLYEVNGNDGQRSLLGNT